MTKNRLPEGWPKNEDELIKQMKSESFLRYCEDRGIFIRFDDANKCVRITRVNLKKHSSDE